MNLHKIKILILSLFTFCMISLPLKAVSCQPYEKCCSAIEEANTSDCSGVCYDPQETNCLLGKLCKYPCYIGPDNPRDFYQYDCCDPYGCCKSSNWTVDNPICECCSE